MDEDFNTADIIIGLMSPVHIEENTSQKDIDTDNIYIKVDDEELNNETSEGS